MEIETSNAIKTFFPKTALVQVLFEAIANSLDAGASEISVSLRIRAFTAPDTLTITITDNGGGFTSERFDRFTRLLNPEDESHKGLGRLVFLNYFAVVDVESIWGMRRRTFSFTKQFKGKSKVDELPAEQPSSTKLDFKQFSGRSINSYDDLSPAPLKRSVIEHFLPTLIQRKSRKQPITIKLDLHVQESNPQRNFFSGDEVLTLDDLPEFETTRIKLEGSLLEADEIEMSYHVGEAGYGGGVFLTAVSIDGRTIPTPLFDANAVPPDYDVIFLFTSKLFHGKADSSRQKFILPESVSETELLTTLRRECGNILAEKVPQINERNTRTEKHLEDRFPHLLGLFDENTVGLIDREAALEVAQRKFFKAQKEVLQSDGVDDRTYAKSLELSSRTLTEYILYRERIIRRMKEMTEKNQEADIHNLIAPRYERFERDGLVESIYRNNAWLLDDKYMSFRSILSEAKMHDVIQAITLEDCPPDEGRPDIALIFSDDPSSAPAVDVVIVELKKISDDRKENQHVVTQLLDRASKLVTYCPKVERIWYYGVIHIDPEMERLLKQQKFTPIFSKGKVLYNELQTFRPDNTVVPTPVFILSFDAIVADAECRNHTFLQLLKSNMKAMSKKAPVKQNGNGEL